MLIGSYKQSLLVGMISLPLPLLRSLALGDRQGPHGKAVYHPRRVGRGSPLSARASGRPDYPESPRGRAGVDWEREDRCAEQAQQRRGR